MMDRVLLVMVLAVTLFSGATSEDLDGTYLACSIGQDDLKTAQCSQHDTVIRVIDVFDLTCPGNDHTCSPDCGDTGTPVIELNPDRYSDIVVKCERQESCEPFDDTTGRVEAVPEAVRYTCVEYTSIGAHSIAADANLSEVQCFDEETILFVSLVYAVYRTKTCSPAVYTNYHLGSADFRFVKDSCDDKIICDHVKLMVHQAQICSTNGRNESLTPTGIAIYYSCNPQTVHLFSTVKPTDHPTDQPAINPSDLTSFSGRSTSSISNDETTDVTYFNDGSDTKTQTAGIQIGLYAGVPVAVLVVVMVIAVSVICVRRKKPLQSTTNYSGTPAAQDMEPSSAPGNIYSLGDEDYSEVGPIFTQQIRAGPTSSQPPGHPAVLASLTGRVVLNSTTGGATQFNTQSEVRSKSSVGDEYAMAQKGCRDSDELVMRDNCMYEATPMVGSQTPGVSATEDTELVDNTQYEPWENPR